MVGKGGACSNREGLGCVCPGVWGQGSTIRTPETLYGPKGDIEGDFFYFEFHIREGARNVVSLSKA